MLRTVCDSGQNSTVLFQAILMANIIHNARVGIEHNWCYLTAFDECRLGYGEWCEAEAPTVRFCAEMKPATL